MIIADRGVHLGFAGAASTRVSNELGAGRAKHAKQAGKNAHLAHLCYLSLSAVVQQPYRTPSDQCIL